MGTWLTVGEAMAYLRVSRPTLYRWCDEGMLTFYELESGGGRRFEEADLDAMLTRTLIDGVTGVIHIATASSPMVRCETRAVVHLDDATEWNWLEGKTRCAACWDGISGVLTSMLSKRLGARGFCRVLYEHGTRRTHVAWEGGADTLCGEVDVAALATLGSPLRGGWTQCSGCWAKAPLGFRQAYDGRFNVLA